MKLIKIFLTFTMISLFVGINSAYNGKIPEQETEKNIPVVDSIQDIEETIEESMQTEECVEEPASDEQKDVLVEQKKEEVTKNNSNEQPISKIEPKNNTQVTVESKPEEVNQKIETPVKKTRWEEIGITEYEYYHSPMMKWQYVTHNSFSGCQKDGDEAIKVKIDPVTGESYQDYTSYWCYDVNSYSGDWLGIMLSLSK